MLTLEHSQRENKTLALSNNGLVQIGFEVGKNRLLEHLLGCFPKAPFSFNRPITPPSGGNDQFSDLKHFRS